MKQLFLLLFILPSLFLNAQSINEKLFGKWIFKEASLPKAQETDEEGLENF